MPTLLYNKTRLDPAEAGLTEESTVGETITVMESRGVVGACLILRGRKVPLDNSLGSLAGEKVFVVGGLRSEADAMVAAEARAKAMAIRKKEVQATMYKAPKTAKRDTYTPYLFQRIEELPQFADRAKARAFLKQLAEDPGVSRVMIKHQYTVGALKEMHPDGKVGVDPVCVMGLNKNKGQEILLRLRTDDLKGFQRYEDVKKVLYHEMAHNEFSEHDNDFKALMSQLIKEGKELDWTQGGRKVGTTAFDVMRIGTELYEPEDPAAFEGGAGTLGAAPDAGYYDRLMSGGGKRAKPAAPREDVGPGALEEFIGVADETEVEAAASEMEAEDKDEASSMAVDKPSEPEIAQPSDVDPEGASDMALDEQNDMDVDREAHAEIADSLAEMGFERSAAVRVLAEVGGSMEIAVLRLCEEAAEAAEAEVQEDTEDLKDGDAEGMQMDAAEAGPPKAEVEEIAPVHVEAPTGESISSAAAADGVEELVAMGFPQPAAQQALQRCAGDLQAAATLLLSGEVLESPPPQAAKPLPSNPNMGPGAEAAVGSSDVDDRQGKVAAAVAELERSAGSQGGSTTVSAALSTLAKVLGNALAHPDEPKFKQVRLDNKAFHNKVAQYHGGITVLLAVGWEERQAGGERQLYFRRPDPGLLWLGKAVVEEALQRIAAI